MPAIILIDKPVGISSFDVIRKLRGKLGAVKMGHAGTLDPLASGLMVIGIGEGTKKLKDYIAHDKEYLADVRIGERRSTGDMEGPVIEEKAVAETLSEERVSATLSGMIGTLRLPVSAYSAMKQGGVPMYKRARQAAKEGREVGTVPIRDMEVFGAELLSLEQTDTRAIIRVRFHVGSGTYIRSLAEELGKRLGYPATLQGLRRTRVGDLDVADAEQI